MTFDEMKTTAAKLLDRDKDDADFDIIISKALNNAYFTVARDKWRPICREVVDINNGEFCVDNACEHFVSLRGAYDENGHKIYSRQVKDYVIVSQTVKKAMIEYYYLPPKMEHAKDEPAIPAEVVDPFAYIFFACSLYCSAKKLHAEASMWDTRFRNIFDNIKEVRTNFVMPTGAWI